MSAYVVERVYHEPHVFRIPCGRYTDKLAAQRRRDRVRRFDPDVWAGLANVCIRKVGGDV